MIEAVRQEEPRGQSFLDRRTRHARRFRPVIVYYSYYITPIRMRQHTNIDALQDILIIF